MVEKLNCCTFVSYFIFFTKSQMKQVITSLFLLTILYSFGQNNLRVNLDEEGTTYIKGAVRANFWARYYQTNPGSTVNGEQVNHISDISIRRLRMNFESQITPNWFFYSNFGTNNVNSATLQSIRLAILDMYAEYSFAPEFALGAGQIGWGGSRATMRSSKAMMGLDTPLFSLFTVDKNDLVGRNLGVFAKGQIGQWSYVATVKNPVKITTDPKEKEVNYAKNAPRKQYSGYLKYDFLDRESNKTSYSGGAGTYIGSKKIGNIAIGGVYQSKMMSELDNTLLKYYDYKNFSSEFFLDTPISERNDAITIYLGYFHTDFGRDYVRKVGANDIADTDGGTSFNGNGNDVPMIGSGNTLFFQGGYLLPKSEKYAFRIQPNINIQHSKFYGLKDATNIYDLGVNVFFRGHDRKLSLSYQNRPVYDMNTEVSSRKGMVVLQFQVEIN